MRTPRGVLVAALWIALAGCGGGGNNGKPAPGPQPLPGTSLPKFVDALPTFNGRRADGTATLHVSMEEFQQKVLPESVYAGLKPPYQNGTFVWGYNIDDAGLSWLARTIEAMQNMATNVIYINSFTYTVLQSLLKVD